MPSFTILYPVGNVPIVQGFGTQPDGSFHPGIDFSVPVGTYVHAAGDGQVTLAGNTDPYGYGNQIIIEHPNGYETFYAHLSQFGVQAGAFVKAGDVIGQSGGAKGAQGAGNSSGPHLHFELRSDPNTPIDPAPYLSGTSSVTAKPSSSSSGGGNSGIDAIASFFSAITTGSTWVRIGEILGGLAIIGVAYYIINNDISFMQAIGAK